MTLDVCIETVFTDLPYWKRMERVASLGYKGVEFWHPEGTWDGKQINTSMPKDPDEVRKASQDNGIQVCGLVMNAWDGLFGGCPTRAEDHKVFLDQVHRMIDFCSQIDCHKGVIMTGLSEPNLSAEEEMSNVKRAFAQALRIAESADFVLLVEPLNTLVDHGGFALDSALRGAELVRGFDNPHMKLLYDIYHMQIMSGNVVATIEEVSDVLGHIHIAGVPGRAEPDRCELNYAYILAQAQSMGYDEWVGLEYFPKVESVESLRRQLSICP